MTDSTYRPVSLTEADVDLPSPVLKPSQSRWAYALQSVLLFVLVATGGSILAGGVSRRLDQQARPSALLDVQNATLPQGSRRGKRAKRFQALALGRMGTSSSFILRSHRQKRRHAAKAASKSVLLVGSHFELGNELLQV